MLNIVFAMLLPTIMMMRTATTMMMAMMMMRTIVLLIWSASYNPVASGWPASSGNELAPDAHLKYSSTSEDHDVLFTCLSTRIVIMRGLRYIAWVEERKMTAALTEWMWMVWLVR